MKVAYWPGCVSRGFTPELHGSMAKVAPLLDIELVELDRANCCGCGVIAEHNQELADTLNARTFALAQQVQGAELMMNICSTCQGAQGECQERLDANAEYRDHVNSTLADEGLAYKRGLTTNKNFLWLLVEEIGLERLGSLVKRPLTNLKVGPFYGCYIVRPRDRLGIDEEHPRDNYLEQLIDATALGRKIRGPRAGNAGAAPPAARRARAGPGAEGARPEPPRRETDVGDRLVDFSGWRGCVDGSRWRRRPGSAAQVRRLRS
jgi:heterodisulfide reductase subunit B